MKDFIGQKLKIGDTVIYSGGARWNNELQLCIVEGFSPKKVRIRTMDDRLMTVTPERCGILEHADEAVTGELFPKITEPPWGKEVDELLDTLGSAKVEIEEILKSEVGKL